MLTAKFFLGALAAQIALADVSDVFNPDYYKEQWLAECASGRSQTPINLEYFDTETLPEGLRTKVQMPIVHDVVLNNVGTTLKLTWDNDNMDESMLPEVVVAGDSINAVIDNPSLEPKRTVKVKPAQMHFHFTSEHLIEGLYYTAEAHIVTFVAKGEAPEWGCDAVWDGGDPVLDRCTAVFGTMFKLSTETTDWMRQVHEEGPKIFGETKPWSGGDFDLGRVLPEDTSYFTYSGSLTTPPCAEGLRWHVFREPLPMDIVTMETEVGWLAGVAGKNGEEAVARTNNRLPLAIDGRNIFWVQDEDSPLYEPSAAGCRPLGAAGGLPAAGVSTPDAPAAGVYGDIDDDDVVDSHRRLLGFFN